jgi:thiamine-phosphate pyrophosphorylase
MFEIVAVTNRALCRGDFLARIEALAESNVSLMLREKDLSPEDYGVLARKVSLICVRRGVSFIAHGFPEAAALPGCAAFHAPLPLLSRRPGLRDELFPLRIGTSVHSIEEALLAVSLGVTYLVAGHIFETGCKKGQQARGLEFLSRLCSRVEIPVYAIGGVSEWNISATRAAGAAGACLMSAFMRCASPVAYAEKLKRNSETEDISRKRGAGNQKILLN